MTEPGEEDGATGRMIDEDRRPTIVIEQLNIQEYAALYICRTKINRLLFIADRCPSMELDALKLAYDEVKKAARDIKKFKEIVAKINGRLGEEYGHDNGWEDDVLRRAGERKDMIIRNIEGSKKTMSKDSTWEAYKMLGHFYYLHGYLDEAFTNFVSMTEYCITASHFVDMCLDIILVSVEMGKFSRVISYASKALHQDALDHLTVSKLCCAAGLAYLEDREYKFAAREFQGISPDIGNSYSEVIAPRDIATYGGVCALASFDREELKNKVIDDRNFQEFLERVPAVRELLNNFYASHFVSSLEYLAVLKPTLMLDIHLHDHVEDLYARIRKKALIQYTLPHSLVDLHVMANAFRTSVMDLEKEFEELIFSDQIQAHIDKQNKVLNVRHEDERNRTIQLALLPENELSSL